MISPKAYSAASIVPKRLYMKYLLLFLITFFGLSAHGQNVRDQIQRDTLCYVFKLNNAQLDYIYKKRTLKDTSWFFQQKVDSFRYNKFDQKKLADGCYLKTQTNQHRATFELIINYPFTLSTKTIKGRHLLVLNDIKDKAEINTADVRLNDRICKYDAGFGAYVLDVNEKAKVKAKKNKYLHISFKGNDYYYYLNRKNNQLPSKNRNYNNSNQPILTPGYFILSQPKYRPLDTLKYTAYIVNSFNGKPLRKKVKLTLKDNRRVYWTKKVKPKTRGSYFSEFVIPDSLKIDKQYKLLISYNKRGESFYTEETFKLEDYKLDKNKYEFIVPKDTFHAGEDAVLFAKATDANGFTLSDTRLNLKLSIEKVFKTYQDTIIFRNNEDRKWYTLDTMMNELEATKITIPKNKLINGLVKYKVVVSMKDVRQEKKQFTKYFYWDAEKERTLFMLASDTIIARQFHLLKDTVKDFDLFIFKDNKQTDSLRIRTPFKKQIAYNYTHAELRDPSTSAKQQFRIRKSMLSLLKLKTNRSFDSVHIKMNYPLSTPLHYKIYRGDKEIASGISNDLNFKKEDKTDEDYYLLVSTNLNGQLASNYQYFKISQDKKQLQISTTDLPKDIYPGDAVKLIIKVKDYKGVGQENVNIASYAVSSMFGEEIQTPYVHTPEARILQLRKANLPLPSREYHTNPLRLSQSFRIAPWMVKTFNLHKNDYYKIHYSLQDVYTHYLPLEIKKKTNTKSLTNKNVVVPQEHTLSELVVLPILAHNITKPSYVTLNGKLIYHTNIDANLPYSTEVKPGKYTVQFRFQDYLIECKNVLVKPNNKTLLCVRLDSILELNKEQYIVKDSLPTFSMTPQEFDQLDENSMFINGLKFDTLKVYPLNNEKSVRYYFGRHQLSRIIARDENFHVVGLPPHSPSENQFVLDMGKKGQKVIFNKKDRVCYLYQNKIEYKSYDSSAAPLFGFKSSQVSYAELLRLANKVKAVQVKKIEKKVAAVAFKEYPKAIRKPNYYSPVGGYTPTTNKNHNVRFDITSADTVLPVGIWFINKVNPNQSGYYRIRGRKKQYINFRGGASIYDIYILYNNKSYQLYASQKIVANEHWYVNTPYCSLMPIEEETLSEPIMLYNQLTKTPIMPFTAYPDENDLKVKVIETADRNAAMIKGILGNRNGQTINHTDIYLEKNGRFYRGATTNNKGEFEFLNVAKGHYMLKVFATSYLARYAYNIHINKNAVFTYQIELSDKRIQLPNLQINENEVSLQIFQTAINKNLKSYGRLYDMETRAPISNATITYLSKSGKKLATYESNLRGEFKLYEQTFVDSAFDILFERTGYATLKLRNVALTSAYINQLDAFMRTKSNLNKLPVSINLQLESKGIVKKSSKAMDEEYSKDKDNYLGGIDGKIYDYKGQTVPFALIVAELNGMRLGATKSDLNGNFRIKNLNPGTYIIKVSQLGYNNLEVRGIEIRSGYSYTKNLKIGKPKSGQKLKRVVVKTQRDLIRREESKLSSISGNEVRKMASVNIVDGLSTMSGVSSGSYSSPVSIAGDRPSGGQYMIDGVQINSASMSNIPPSALGEADILVKFENKIGLVQNGKKGYNFYKAAKAKSLRTRFSNLGYWVPNIKTNKDGIATATVTFPDDVTRWRSFIVAMGSKYKNGVHSTSIRSYKPIMVNSIVPRFLYLSDKLEAKSKFVNLDSSKHNVNIKISLNNDEKVNKNILLDRQYVDSTILSATTTDSIIWRAELDMDTYYKDGEEIKIPVFKDGLETKEYDLKVFKKDSTHRVYLGEKTKTTIYFNNTVLENILVEINKLKNYPYACNEQKASKVKGLLVEEKIRKQLKQKFEHKGMIKKLINRLERTQKSNGAWSWWTNGSANNRMTLYIADVLQQANRAGYNNSAAVLAKNYIRKNIKRFNTSDKLYALYLLKKMNTNVKYTNIIKGIDFYDLNACDKLYYISNQYAYTKKISKSQVATCINQINAGSMQRYSGNFFYDPSANMALAVKLLNETPMKNNVVKSIAPLVQSGRYISKANTFSKVYLIEAWLQSLQDQKQSVTAKIVINDTLTIDKFPYKYTTTDANVNIQHTGSEVWTSLVRDVYLPNPAKRDSLFDVRTQFLVKGKKVEKLSVGTDAVIELKVMSFRTAKNVMLEVPIPSGCTYNGKKTPRGAISHIEYYKHKAIYYIENMRPGEFTIKLPVRVNFSGDFSLPPSNISLMYYPFKSGNNTKKRITATD